ncbi:transposase [Archangium minus]|uniref:Transposase n=1 Tax=Archangium minus TaxID=83450 RepID=A0ABY9X8C5_9BACT|nr:transposase [Archangium minus]
MGVPEDVRFERKWEIALHLVDDALEWGVRPYVALADAGYGDCREFREALTRRGLPYVVGVQGTHKVWPPGVAPGSLLCWRTLPGGPWCLAKLRWRVERDYQEMKQEVGLDAAPGAASITTPPSVLSPTASSHSVGRFSPCVECGGRCLRCVGACSTCCCVASAIAPSACAPSPLALSLSAYPASDRVVLARRQWRPSSHGPHF